MKLVELLGGRLAHERAQRVRERAERQALAAHLDAAAGEDPRARLARALGGLLDEPRLADAGLATEEHDRGIARDGSVERRRQRRQLGIPADEDRTDQSACHRAPCSQLSSRLRVLGRLKSRVALWWRSGSSPCGRRSMTITSRKP